MVEEIIPKISKISQKFIIFIINIFYLDKVRQAFDTGVTRPVAWRKAQLR